MTRRRAAATIVGVRVARHRSFLLASVEGSVVAAGPTEPERAGVRNAADYDGGGGESSGSVAPSPEEARRCL